MRKSIKLIFPLLIISSLLMVGVRTTNASTWTNPSYLGVKVGQAYGYTLGWNYGLNLPDSVWNEISSVLSTKNLTIDAKQMYADFNSLPHVFNMKAFVDYYPTKSYLLNGPHISTEFYNTTYQMKLVNEKNYMDLNSFFSHLKTIGNSTTQKYDSLFSSLTNESDFFSGITDYVQVMFPEITSVSFNGSFMYNLEFSLFIPANMSFVARENAEKEYPFYYDLHHFDGLPSTVSTFSGILKAMGVTTFDVKNKSILVNYNFTDMNQDWLNFLTNSSKTFMNYFGVNSFSNILMGLNFPVFEGTNYLPLWLWNPFNDAINFNQFLQYLSSQLNWTITTPNITATADLTYDSHGILQNAHSEYNVSTTINGTPVNFNPQFDISSGIHNSIDAKWNKSTIPGYPIGLTGLASLGGIMVVALIMRKKKTVRFNQ